MARRGVWVLLWVVTQAAAVEVVSQPAGARVRWSRADSPLMHVAGVTPCRLELPAEAGCVVELTLAGYLPVFRAVPDDATRLEVELTRFQPELLPQLCDSRGLPALPLKDAREDADHFQHERRPACDGAGVYESVTAEQFGSRGRRRVSDQLVSLYWREFGQPARRLCLLPRSYGEHCTYPELASSPDGRWLACSCSDDEDYWLGAISRETAEHRRLARLQHVLLDYPTWSADGRYLSYTAYDPGLTGQEEHTALHRVDWVTGRDQRLAQGAGTARDETPDGRYLAATVDDDLVVLDLTTGEKRTVAAGVKVTDEEAEAIMTGSWRSRPTSPARTTRR